MIARRMMMSREKDIPPTSRIRFIASKDGSGINFFQFDDQKLPPASLFAVSVNGVETAQAYSSLSFSAGDDVSIQLKTSRSYYPVFYPGRQLAADALDYILQIVEPLPEMKLSATYPMKSGYGLFRNCITLTSLLKGLFSNNPNITDFGGCFCGCNCLASVPILFDNTPKRYELWFLPILQRLASIPTGLFDNHPGTFITLCLVLPVVASLPPFLSVCSTTIRNWLKLITVSQDAKNSHPFPLACLITIRISKSYGLFRECSGIIPSCRVVDNNPKITNFGSCFHKCSGLVSVPSDLFANNPNVIDFSACFQGSTSLTSLPAGLFANNQKVTAFNSCFYRCVYITSAVPELWARTGVTRFYGCFYGCTQAANYADIPDDWK